MFSTVFSFKKCKKSGKKAEDGNTKNTISTDFRLSSNNKVFSDVFPSFI